ncbi:hypothetical protein LMG8520_0633 [Lactococcus lactis subsp. lactis]|uniref:Uncharacterized protein n=2 Tax=Lactococcus lactis TaxID=1358 RepID=A0A2A5SCY0_LACLH|nr:hypothetical protein LMG8520_0633 [Lactococcus lactis subsp. lactis]PCS11300.1 hypothetical protein RU90_GL000782 [Lactococcus lactis subsp. hordniae]
MSILVVDKRTVSVTDSSVSKMRLSNEYFSCRQKNLQQILEFCQ